MNRFITDLNPVIAAQHQCDKHLRKMIIEEAQMLSTALHDWRPHLYGEALYKPVHNRHPCTLWAGASSPNWLWGFAHFIGLCKEYEFRFDKMHMTATKLLHVFCDIRNRDDFESDWKNTYTAAPQCFGDWPHKTKEDWPVLAYRAYLRDYKPTVMKTAMTWTRRTPPKWFNNKENAQ